MGEGLLSEQMVSRGVQAGRQPLSAALVGVGAAHKAPVGFLDVGARGLTPERLLSLLVFPTGARPLSSPFTTSLTDDRSPISGRAGMNECLKLGSA